MNTLSAAFRILASVTLETEMHDSGTPIPPPRLIGCSRLVKYERSHLDAFARRRICGTYRIREGAVWSETRPPIRLGVEAFEQQCLVHAHPWHVEPSVRRTVAHLIGLADTVRIDEVPIPGT